jgi:uncharacterized membrane protein YdbT with pleckstrin-like domain
MEEKTLWEGHPCMARCSPFQFVLVIVLCLVLIGLPLLLIWWLRCVSTTLTVTTYRTILRKGILSKSTNEVRHCDVRNIQVKQSILQRIFGTGSIGISSAGQAEVEIYAEGIASPQQVASLIRQNQSNR